MGSGGSRLLSGNVRYAEELESWIAMFHNRPAGLMFNSGYDANLGLMSCLPQHGDAVVCDELVHNSVVVRDGDVCAEYADVVRWLVLWYNFRATFLSEYL